jgi:hypothetical protein
MQKTAEGQLSPEVVLAEMTKNGVTHVVWLPDSETNFLYQLMQRSRWQTRTRDKVLADFRDEFGTEGGIR